MSEPRNEIIYDRDFLRDVCKLSNEIQEKLAGLLEILQEDSFDP